MKTVLFSAIALACTPFLAAAQQSGGVAYPDNWTGGAPLPAINQTYQAQPYGSYQPQNGPQYQPQYQPVYRPTDYFAVNQARRDEQPHLQTYEATQPQTVYERRPHHRPDNLAGYWPFISKAHADRDFQRNWIHVYGGGEPTPVAETQR